MIIHYTKVVVNAMGAEEGWDTLVGFPVEIEPLVRPYGLWTGNAFRGIVKKHGEPVPFCGNLKSNITTKTTRLKFRAIPLSRKSSKPTQTACFRM